MLLFPRSLDAIRPSPNAMNDSAVSQVLSAESCVRSTRGGAPPTIYSVGQIYLLDNPLLRESIKPHHIKPRLLGHWGTCPGLNLIYAHLNRLIRKFDLNMIYVPDPGMAVRHWWQIPGWKAPTQSFIRISRRIKKE